MQLESLLERAPDNRALWMRLIKLLHQFGEHERELAALRAMLDRWPEDVEAHGQAAKLLTTARRWAEAEPHLAALARLSPPDIMAWIRLALCHAELGETPAEVEAWRQVCLLDPNNQQAQRRLIAGIAACRTDTDACRALDALPEQPAVSALALAPVAEALRQAGRPLAEIKILRLIVLSADGGGGHALRALLAAARRLDLLGEAELALLGWRKVLVGDSAQLEAGARSEEAKDARGASPRLKAVSAAAARAKLVVIGNCQAYALARHFRASCPELEVRAIGLVELTDAEAIETLAQRHADARWVVTQPLDPAYGPLATEALVARGKQVGLFPKLYFPGLQPDGLRADLRPLRGLRLQGYHSAIVLAACALGVPPPRIPELFNAFVYGVLGYFDAYAKSEAYLLAQAQACELDIGPALQSWIGAGSFVHLPNHPKPAVLSWLAREIGAQLALPMTGREPEPLDVMAPFGSWPVYPELARRLGFAGSLEFRLERGGPVLDLEALCARGSRDCADIPRPVLREHLGPVVDALEREGV
jgi:tetratricopeptide (TPR) repeat protein